VLITIRFGEDFSNCSRREQAVLKKWRHQGFDQMPEPRLADDLLGYGDKEPEVCSALIAEGAERAVHLFPIRRPALLRLHGLDVAHLARRERRRSNRFNRRPDSVRGAQRDEALGDPAGQQDQGVPLDLRGALIPIRGMTSRSRRGFWIEPEGFEYSDPVP
jgi:hypothetical protein